MAAREGNLWSRTWGAVAVAGFTVHLGAAIYEAVVVAPLWALHPPQSVVAWAGVATRPDSSRFFQPLAAVVVVATAMAWISGIATRGWRRWWLTLALLAAGALGVVTVLHVMPCERELFGAGALGDVDGATLTSLTGDWIRAAAMRLVALVVGAWAAYRAQVAGMVADLPSAVAALGADADVVLGEPGAARGRRARPREFSLGDEAEPEVVLGDEAVKPRDRWRGSLPGRRRTAKK